MLVWRTRPLFAHTLLVAAVAASWGCGAADDAHPAPVEGDREPAQVTERLPVDSGAGAASGDCAPGVVQECKVMLGGQGNVVNCFVGVQVCSEGEWGPCQDPDEL